MLLYVDVIDACHLKCPTCVRGVRAFPNTATRMPLETFRAIVAKGKADGAYRVDMFSWIEPFLCPNLHEYVAIVKEAGLPCGLSTTLSLRRIHEFEATLRNTDVLTVSISGFDQAVYEINHRGGNVEYVKANLEALAALKRSGRTGVEATLRMLMFDYNAAEEPKLRSLAAGLGIGFEVLMAEGHPIRAPQDKGAGDEVRARLARFSPERSDEPPARTCPLVFEHVVVNAAGDVYQCSAYGNYPVMKIGPFLELTREEVLLRRYFNPVCHSCPWVRRPVTPVERVLLQQALAVRLGEEVADRVPALSGPLAFQPTTSEGYLVSKSRQWLAVASEAGGAERRPRTVRDLARDWSDEAYLALMLRSLGETSVDGVRMPGFPDEPVQRQFVGSTGEAALREGYDFYRCVKAYCRAHGVRFDADTRILDFGCGWGRVARFFFRDVEAGNFWGVDVDPQMVSFCAAEMTCGRYRAVDPEPPMSFMENGSLDVVFAYSVFSHLAEAIAQAWIREFARVLKPGGILLATTQGRSFLDFCQSLSDRRQTLEFGWFKGLADSFQPIEKAKEDYDRGRFLFAATGGGGPREPSFYGEAVIPRQYVEREYGRFLAFRDFTEDPTRQALFVMQKPA